MIRTFTPNIITWAKVCPEHTLREQPNLQPHEWFPIWNWRQQRSYMRIRVRVQRLHLHTHIHTHPPCCLCKKTHSFASLFIPKPVHPLQIQKQKHHVYGCREIEGKNGSCIAVGSQKSLCTKSMGRHEGEGEVTLHYFVHWSWQIYLLSYRRVGKSHQFRL